MFQKKRKGGKIYKMLEENMFQKERREKWGKYRKRGKKSNKRKVQKINKTREKICYRKQKRKVGKISKKQRRKNILRTGNTDTSN